MATYPASFASERRSLQALRRFVQPRGGGGEAERCEMCSRELAPEHQHLLEIARRRLVCVCDACAVLFDGQDGARFRRLPRRGRRLLDFVLADSQWDRLLIPINVAFFYYSTTAEKTVAMYPGPAGAAESLLPLEAWDEVVAQNHALQAMQPDVEALLVNRLGPARGFAEAEHYLTPIDACYKLVGLIRSRWHGLSGGGEVWRGVSDFFAELKRSCAVDGRTAAVPRNGAVDA